MSAQRGATHRAGAAAVDITPALGGPAVAPTLLAGFWPARPATGIHSPLEVRAVALAALDGPPVVLAVAPPADEDDWDEGWDDEEATEASTPRTHGEHRRRSRNDRRRARRRGTR